MFCLVIAIATLGVKPYPRALAADGWRPAVAAVVQTLALAAAAFTAVAIFA